jgi:hypothetical protein
MINRIWKIYWLRGLLAGFAASVILLLFLYIFVDASTPIIIAFEGVSLPLMLLGTVVGLFSKRKWVLGLIILISGGVIWYFYMIIAHHPVY